MLQLRSVKEVVKTYLPGGTRVIRKLLPRRTVFWLIHYMNHWSSEESRSGPGSTLRATDDLRRELPELIKEFAVKSMLDAACGDFHWMSTIDLPCQYIGSEIVGTLVNRLSGAYGSPTRRFIQRDICRDQLPNVDLIFCREVTIHLPTKDVLAALRNFRASGSTYLLITHHFKVKQNGDIPVGGWRAINFTLPPFSFPEPLRLISEGNADQDDKTMGLWRLDDLPLD